MNQTRVGHDHIIYIDQVFKEEEKTFSLYVPLNVLRTDLNRILIEFVWLPRRLLTKSQ